MTERWCSDRTGDIISHGSLVTQGFCLFPLWNQTGTGYTFDSCNSSFCVTGRIRSYTVVCGRLRRAEPVAGVQLSGFASGQRFSGRFTEAFLIRRPAAGKIFTVAAFSKSCKALYINGFSVLSMCREVKKMRFSAVFRKKIAVCPEGEKTADGGLCFSKWLQDFFPPTPYALKNKAFSEK